ncbi:MAG: ATP-binding protein [Candidatus Dormibacteria bacterium]
MQKYLGEELIADPNLAVLEFVKNSYDAGAHEVCIDFEVSQPDHTRLTISDDGDGMDEASFRTNWMAPGYSSKAQGRVVVERSGTQRAESRVPVGEKGLGRLAAGRLGTKLEVFTRRTADESWLHVVFDWSHFEDMNLNLDEIEVPFDHTTQPPAPETVAGTIVVITGLRQLWDTRVPGRPVAGRSRTRLGRLKQDLGLLLRPLEATEEPFTVHLASDSILEEEDVGVITPTDSAVDADYEYDFIFGIDPLGSVRVTRTLKRGDRLRTEIGGLEAITDLSAVLGQSAESEHRPHTLECGPFRGKFTYLPPQAAHRAKVVDAIGHGVLLYRDKVLVEPFGLGSDDWVGASARKAQRQGYALVQPATFAGFVLITRDANPEVRDMSNREGLIHNIEAEVFLGHVRAEFRVFEGLVSTELAQRWQSIEEKTAKQSTEALELSALRLRAIAHSLAQPLLGLAADVESVAVVARRRNLPEAVGFELNATVLSARGHLERVRLGLERFRDIPVGERTMVDVSLLLRRACAEVDPIAKEVGLKVASEGLPPQRVLVHEELLVEAFKELLTNALEAAQGRSADAVQVSFQPVNGDVVVAISDHGGGIPGGRPDMELTEIISTKGRPGQGLATVERLVTASRGRIRLAKTGPQGTRFEVTLPSRLGGLLDPNRREVPTHRD